MARELHKKKNRELYAKHRFILKKEERRKNYEQ